MTQLKPFAEDAASISIGELTIENGTDRIALYESLDLARDKQGLTHARALVSNFKAEPRRQTPVWTDTLRTQMIFLAAFRGVPECSR